jgi:hypothetical protein
LPLANAAHQKNQGKANIVVTQMKKRFSTETWFSEEIKIALLKLNTRAVYCDTDSVIYKSMT